MLCKKFRTIMSTDACIKRRQYAIKNEKLVFDVYGKVNNYSLEACYSCEQGKAVSKNPNRFINRDFLALKERHKKEIHLRGYTFKESIDYNSLFSSFNCSMIKIKQEGNYDKSNKRNDRERIRRFIIKHRNFTRSKQNILSRIRFKFKIKRLHIRRRKN